MDSPIGIPTGADAHVKYQSRKSFGAVLIARNPVEVTAYNDECLFEQWIEDNKAQLYNRFGHQLKKYGLWIVTVTYTAPGCSINAWMNKDKHAVLSAKAKAAMVGDLGAELVWTDMITDKDWCHYTAKSHGHAIDGQPAIVHETAEAERSAGQRPLSKSKIPRPVASAIDPQTMKDTAPRRDASKASAPSPSVRHPERTLSRKPAISPVGNHIRISAVDSRVSHDLNLNSPNVQGTELGPVSGMISETTDHSNFRGPTAVKPTHSVSSVDRAASEGVVMFYDGLYLDPLDWWAEGTKSAFFLFGSKRHGQEPQSGKAGQHILLRSCSARYQPNPRPQLFSHNDETYNNQDDIISHRPHYPYDDSDIGHHPEKDKGVHPRYWPVRGPGLRTTSNAINQRSSITQSCKGGNNISASRTAKLDEKISH